MTHSMLRLRYANAHFAAWLTFEVYLSWYPGPAHNTLASACDRHLDHARFDYYTLKAKQSNLS